MLKKILETAGEAAKIAGEQTLKAAKASAEFIYDHREEIKGGTVGAAKQAVKTGKGLYGYTYSEKDFEKLRERIREQQKGYASIFTLSPDLYFVLGVRVIKSFFMLFI